MLNLKDTLGETRQERGRLERPRREAAEPGVGLLHLRLQDREVQGVGAGAS